MFQGGKWEVDSKAKVCYQLFCHVIFDHLLKKFPNVNVIFDFKKYNEKLSHTLKSCKEISIFRWTEWATETSFRFFKKIYQVPLIIKVWNYFLRFMLDSDQIPVAINLQRSSVLF